MSLDYVAIDFETANSSSASACSVGLVKVVGGRVVDKVGWLIRPPVGHDFFSEWNTRIHGIVESDVVDALEWHEQMGDLVDFVGDEILVAHNAGFDMGVIRGGCAATAIETPSNRYFCSLQVARKTYTLDSYRLPMAAMAAGFDEFAHHDALADAEACAAIIAHSAKRHGADSVDELAAATGVRVNVLRPAAAASSVRFV